MAEGSDDPFPEGLLAHAELQLRRAYEHSAVERAREVADRTGGGGAASTSDGPADVAALDPPSPNDGIVAALDALRRIAVESAARAGAHANEGEDDAADAKRRRKGEAGDGGGGRERRRGGRDEAREDRNLSPRVPREVQPRRALPDDRTARGLDHCVRAHRGEDDRRVARGGASGVARGAQRVEERNHRLATPRAPSDGGGEWESPTAR